MTIRVRPLEAVERRLFRYLRLRASADSPDSFRETLAEVRGTTDEHWADPVASTAEPPHGLLLAAEEGGAGVGLAFARIDDDLMLHTGARWFAGEARRRGAGRMLLDTALDWGRSFGGPWAAGRCGSSGSIPPTPGGPGGRCAGRSLRDRT